MAMSIHNSKSSQVTLSEFNRNTDRVGKAMLRVANGQKINSAEDDASQYAVSERMRELIRGLEQAGQNVQNDSAMLKTAEAAAASTLEIIKTIKDKAVQSANDDNTDADRAVIQKEIDQLIDQVNDNAMVTFNGKHLLDGSSSPLYLTTDAETAIIRGLHSSWLRTSLDIIKDSYGLSFEEPNTSIKHMTVHLADEGDTGNLAYVTHMSSDSDGKAVALELHVNMYYYNSIDKLDPNGSAAMAGAGFLDRTLIHEMTHAVMAANIDYFSELPGWVKEGGSAELVHGVDDTRDLEDTGDDYSGGFVKMRYMAYQSSVNARDFIKTFMHCLDETSGREAGLNYAIKTASHGRFANVTSFEEQFANDIAAAGGYEEFLRLKCGIILDDNDVGAITGFDAGDGPMKDKYNTVREASRPANWRLPTSASTLINGLEVIWPKGYMASDGGTFSFQVGARSNERINVGLFNMTAQYIGLTDENGDNISVRTQKDANEAINHLNRVLDVVLDQQTMIGALQQRLEATHGNVSSSTDNIRAAESTIRDSDIAREMTELHQAQVLQQASQAMLSKSNENLQQGLQTITSNGTNTVSEAADVSTAKSATDKNLSAVGKDLQKITTGQKLNSAADDASAYSISEEMRVEIRSLEQDVQNVQNGHCMMTIAEKAIGEQIEIVKRLHEIGMRSSDAACNQLDRDVLQKEVSQLADQLELIAQQTTYNGKCLLNGMFQKKYIERRFSNFDPAGEVQYNKISGLWPSYPQGRSYTNPPYYGYTADEVELDFSNGRGKHGGALSINDLDMQGMSLLCAGCGQFVSILFDASRDVGEGVYMRDTSRDNGFGYAYNASEAYIVGIRDVGSFEGVYNAIFQGIAHANDNNPLLARSGLEDDDYTAYITAVHEVAIEGSGGSYSLTKNGPNFVMLNGFKGTLDVEENVTVNLRIQGTPNSSMYTNFKMPVTTVDVLFQNGIDETTVRTWENAQSFLVDTNKALNNLLISSAIVGAQARRMEYMTDNINAMRDNVQAAESAIRDVDMARAITKYARDNVLAQASQSMLAQSIQNPRLVMSLM